MLFNSLDFAVFLPIVFAIYWLIGSVRVKWQNAFLVFASYVFYGWWDWRFLSLILFSTLVDYFVGRKLKSEVRPPKRKTLLWVSILVNLGFLGFFKYYNFFVDSFIDAFSLFGQKPDIHTLNIVLPVGISFYTFQTLSYTIDVYKEKLEPTGDFIAFTAFVSFFPQLVAGPIERARHLLPQFYHKRVFDYAKAVDGMRQILWGFFKKLVIADNCAQYVNTIFSDHEAYPASMLVVGAVLFAFQIYGDFSGYSDIAIGTARLFGFDLMKNFAFPYFSRDIAEFWRRWHISLSTWFRDYLYIPLGGSRVGFWKKVRNTFVVFVVSGFWHGANWTFIAWGALNALFFLPLLITQKNRQNIGSIAEGRHFASLKEMLQILLTFALTCLAWIFFRAESISQAFSYTAGIFESSLFSRPGILSMGNAATVIVLLGFFICIEWLGREREYAIEKMGLSWPRPLRWAFYAFLVFLIGMFMPTVETPFIYFQF